MTDIEAIRIVEDTRKWLYSGCHGDQPHNHIKTDKAFEIFLKLIYKFENDNGWVGK
jgi:hypothetical protein